MSSVIDRYERVANGYRHWAVVLRPGGERLLDRIERLRPGLADGEIAAILDVGCGSGNQLLGAARRWTGARIVGLDAAAAMLRQAQDGLQALGDAAASRVELAQGDAAAVPFSEGAFDIVMSGFVVQLVLDRPAVLREMHRVLKPGGIVGIAGWLAERDELPFGPEEAFEESLAELAIDRPDREERRAGDFASVRSAAEELRRAGFRRVAARADVLDHLWTPASYAAYKRESRERDIYDSLPSARADELAATFRARLDRLFAADPSAFRFQPPIVSILAIKP